MRFTLKPQFWKNLSICQLVFGLILGLGLVMLIMLSVAYSSYYSMMDHHGEEDGIQALIDLVDEVGQRTDEFIFSNGDPVEREKLRTKLSALKPKMRQIHSVDNDNTIDPIVFDKIDNLIQQLDDVIYPLLNADKLSHRDPVMVKSEHIVHRQITLLRNTLHQLYDKVSDEAFAAEEVILHNIIFAFVTTILLMIGISVVIKRSISAPMRLLSRVRDMMTVVREGGDLSSRIEVDNGNEVGLLAYEFNTLMENLHTTIGQASHTAVQVAANAGQLVSVINQTNDGVNQQNHEINNITSTIKGLSEAVLLIERNTASAAVAAQQAKAEASKGKEVVSDATSTIHTLADEIRHAEEVVNQLGEQTGTITSIAGLIREIAEQTNLLSLNAAIEAARAGEAGRGFAVVASEVRNLANRTQQSTEEIHHTIEQLKNSVNAAVSVMTRSREQSEQCVTKTEQTGESLKRIKAAVSTMNDMNLEIATTAKEQGEAAQEIDANLESLSAITGRTAQATTMVQVTSDELMSTANKLKSEIGHFDPNLHQQKTSDVNDTDRGNEAEKENEVQLF
jgi:methyl-accepting chemotaxis protein